MPVVLPAAETTDARPLALLLLESGSTFALSPSFDGHPVIRLLDALRVKLELSTRPAKR